jgi:hypothetical protein
VQEKDLDVASAYNVFSRGMLAPNWTSAWKSTDELEPRRAMAEPTPPAAMVFC